MFGIDDAALAMLVAGGLSTAGSLYANAKNRKMQGDINDVSVNLANTAHQREVLDLLQAGLNPILSSKGSGASVPNLVAPSIENAMSGAANGLSGAAGYINDAYKAQASAADSQAKVAALDASIRNQQQTTAELDAQTDYQLADIRNKAMKSINGEDYTKLFNATREGIISSAKDQANQNWRNNMGAFGGILGPILNAASTVFRAFK